MIPVGDSVPRRGTPVGNWILIIINFFVFFIELAQGPGLEEFVYRFGLIPAVLTGFADPSPGAPSVMLTLFTSMFLHGGWGHILGNMLFLWVFGDNVEDAMGTGRYIIFYLLCGLIAALVQAVLLPTSTLPNIGASGAISGILGAYLVMYPRAIVLVVIPLFLFFPVIEVPVFVMLGIWFLTQFLSGIAALAVTLETGGIAWWAHVAGFAAGALLIFLFRSRRREEDWRISYR